jgi:NAD(P)-dependent dehydrogenase (short-subunit alcohol dehydrogenase family)
MMGLKFAADGSNVVLLHTSHTRCNAELLAKAINARKVGIALLAEVDFPALCARSRNPTSPREPDDMDAEDEEPNTNDKLAETLTLLGKVDILVHAGEDVQARSLVEVNEELFDDMLEYNVKHPLFLTKFVAPHMREGTFRRQNSLQNLISSFKGAG